jgi:hypothetical protein
MEKLTEWQSTFEKRLDRIEAHLKIAQGGVKYYNAMPETLKLAITLPEADIGGLHFNRQEVTGVFDLKEDGWYCCRNILFLSSRNTEDDNSRDILSEYLKSGEVAKAFIGALRTAHVMTGSIDVSLPSENGGMKKYNGANWWYWLKDRCSVSAASFCYVNNAGSTNYYIAGSVGGCAPAFRVV